ncbi:hypothetical protein M409DRAFT_60529 [Zasmidium cellare ATCC 36951]|uniref:Uncharacterized protein n=1 Tax=Zasmidium cellare ATCC 36951 TaxID=1080233 RepID=A0A6A6BY70_ZASCE|nr:uncharacterized protein M409DRAFT_60529 [Zasmidium cellare ATCC 36951]KAF2159754.1 hypothetical protein M409DRAFT_60529 [Zasmidium cellare ATCC 36951]
MATPTTQIMPLATFEIHSGHLCYGALHNIYHGASSDKVGGLPLPQEPIPGGTIRRHEAAFNLPALIGTWNIYALIGKYGDNMQIVAYFASHHSLDPAFEVDKILRVSGSPYERDSGSTFKDNDTAREGVFVINRYDWGWIDSRGGEEVQEAEVPIDLPYHFSTIGLVDFDTAKDFVSRLKFHRADQRDMVGEDGRGVWLTIRDAEYQFGRFGQLRDGFDFSQRHRVKTLFADEKPGDAELLGPYASGEYVLSRADVDAVKDHLSQDPLQPESDPFLNLNEGDTSVKEGLEKWWSASVDLTNQILLSFLEYSIVPYLHEHPHESPATATRLLFPDGSNDPQPGKEYNFTLAEDLKSRFLGNENNASSSSTATSDPEHAPVKARMRIFLEDRRVHPEEDFLESVCRVLAFIVKDLMEMAKRSSVDNERFGHIVPSDVFLAVMNDTSWYQHNLSRSRAFWCL